jgi:hypothetical protein
MRSVRLVEVPPNEWQDECHPERMSCAIRLEHGTRFFYFDISLCSVHWTDILSARSLRPIRLRNNAIVWPRSEWQSFAQLLWLASLLAISHMQVFTFRSIGRVNRFKPNALSKRSGLQSLTAPWGPIATLAKWITNILRVIFLDVRQIVVLFHRWAWINLITRLCYAADNRKDDNQHGRTHGYTLSVTARVSGFFRYCKGMAS